MGVTKKPTVAAKTVAKKRGRPAGSKNKSKKIILSTYQVQTAQNVVVNWEKLAKQLQEALSAEMKANESLQSVFDEFQSKVIIAESVSFGKRLKFLFTGNL
jgi:hypothetical protein